jgi:hypothetical protein
MKMADICVPDMRLRVATLQYRTACLYTNAAIYNIKKRIRKRHHTNSKIHHSKLPVLAINERYAYNSMIAARILS